MEWSVWNETIHATPHHRHMYLNTWSPAENGLGQVVKPLGSRALLEEVSHWGQILRACGPPCFQLALSVPCLQLELFSLCFPSWPPAASPTTADTLL